MDSQHKPEADVPLQEPPAGPEFEPSIPALDPVEPVAPAMPREGPHEPEPPTGFPPAPE
jgi:hypothetical protein